TGLPRESSCYVRRAASDPIRRCLREQASRTGEGGFFTPWSRLASPRDPTSSYSQQSLNMISHPFGTAAPPRHRTKACPPARIGAGTAAALSAIALLLSGCDADPVQPALEV